MTYDPGTDTVTTENSLTPDEQESLKVGEELQAQQEGLLAGKYKNAEELERAYGELEKKLGENLRQIHQKLVQKRNLKKKNLLIIAKVLP